MINISRSKGSQELKFGQLIEYDMGTWETFFSKNNTQKVVEKIFQDPFPKNRNSLKFYTVCLYCMPSSGLSKYIETKQLYLKLF